MQRTEDIAPTFISTQELADLLETLKDNELKIFDCTIHGAPEDGDPILVHKKSHIPRSNFWDQRYQREMTNPIPFMLQSAKQFTDYLKLMDVNKKTRVVLYDNKAGSSYWATRVYWVFRIFGHQNVSVLDGGFKKWLNEGRQVESTPVAESEDLYDFKLNPEMYKTFEQICELEAQQSSDIQLLDGRLETAYKKNHIPIAKNLSFKSLQNADETVKTPDDIKKTFADHDVDLTKPTLDFTFSINKQRAKNLYQRIGCQCPLHIPTLSNS